MPRPKGTPKTGGRKKGSLNTRTGCEQEFRDAWKKCAGPKTAARLIKDAVMKAIGYEVREETLNAEGEVVKTKVLREYNYMPLSVILPYIAQRMAQDVTVDGKEGEAVLIRFVPLNANRRS